MITHIVCFTLRDRADGPELVRRLQTMDGKIETLRSISAGTDVVSNDTSYDVGLVTTFDDLDGLQVYQDHPVHVEVVAYAKTVITGRVNVDFQS